MFGRVFEQLSSPNRFRYFDVVVAAYITVLIGSNFIAASKIAVLGPIEFDLFGQPLQLNAFVFGAGILFFPFSYIFADILTEVYGYAAARRCVWLGFASMIVTTIFAQMVLAFPPDPGWQFPDGPSGVDKQQAWETVFRQSWRLVPASMIAFWAGEMVNNFVLSKMKLLTQGRWLWTRTIGSTIAGQFADSLLFYPIAFLGVWSNQQVAEVMIMNFLLKVAVEAVFTPWTYLVVGWLKRAENYDAYDVGVDYNPFHVRFEYGEGQKPDA